MTRLRAIAIQGFRGIKNYLPVEFGRRGQSCAIYGENAVGKSSIADGIEWFFTDRVNHLWRENCKDTSLRHLLIPDSSESSVSLEFTNSTLNCTKTLSSKLDFRYSNKSAEFTNTLDLIRNGHERVLLRNIDLWTFILSTKTQKRIELADLIGYGDLDSFREVIGQVQTKLERTPDYITAKRNIPEHQKDLFKLAGAVPETITDFYAAATNMANSVGVRDPISDDSSFSKAIEEIRKRIEGKDKAKAKLALSQCRDLCVELKPKVAQVLESYRVFITSYGELLKSEAGLQEVKLQSFLTLGQTALSERLVTRDHCPLCLQPKPWLELRDEIQNRLATLTESKKAYDSAFANQKLALAQLGETLVSTRALYKAAKPIPDDSFLEALTKYGSCLRDTETAVKGSIEKYEPINSTVEGETSEAITALDDFSERLKGKIDQLELSKEEQQFFEVARNLENFRTSYNKYLGATQTTDAFSKQMQSIALIATRFASIQATAMQKVLDILSADISGFYLAMHPDEEVDKITLRLLDEGIEFEYAFHGKRVYPPLKYLSESHLNSLGIAAFLASAKAFNRNTGFLVLDDVVTSFDSNHRIRLVNLIQQEFKHLQVIILTHEPFWFQILKKQLLGDGWLAMELESGPTSEVQIKASLRTFKERLAQKHLEKTLSANDTRTYLERLLKELCFMLEAKLPFRSNDDNEKRMPGELLSGLRSRLRKKSPLTLQEGVFSRLETCNMIASAGSHDSGPVLNSGDVATTYTDITSLDNLFCCDSCGKYVSAQNYIPSEKQIHCHCGKKRLAWNE